MIPSRRRRTEERPSHQELTGKIARLRELVEGGLWLPADPMKLKGNWDELEKTFRVEVALLEDQRAILSAVCVEILPEHYVGGRPPQKSYERRTWSYDLFAFCWESGFFQKRLMYFKFSIGRKGKDQRAFIYSLHPSRDAGRCQ